MESYTEGTTWRPSASSVPTTERIASRSSSCSRPMICSLLLISVVMSVSPLWTAVTDDGWWNWWWVENWWRSVQIVRRSGRGARPLPRTGREAGGPIGRDVDGRRRRRLQRLDPREHERGDQTAGVGLVARVEVAGRCNGVGQDDPGRPLGHPLGLVRAHPAGEEGGGELRGRRQQPVGLVEGEVSEDDAGLVFDEEVEGGVVPEAGRGLDDPTDQRRAEVAGVPQSDTQGTEEAGHLGVDDGTQDLVPSTGEGPVDGGPGHSGLAGDVVDGGLRRPVAGQAGQGAVDDADPVRRLLAGSGRRRGDEGHDGAHFNHPELPQRTCHQWNSRPPFVSPSTTRSGRTARWCLTGSSPGPPRRPTAPSGPGGPPARDPPGPSGPGPRCTTAPSGPGSPPRPRGRPPRPVPGRPRRGRAPRRCRPGCDCSRPSGRAAACRARSA